MDRVSPATLQLERIYVNRFLEWCIDMGYLDRNPMKPIPSVPVQVKVRPTISSEQFEALKQASTRLGSMMYSLMVIAWYTGARLVDIAHLRWAELDFGLHTWTYVPRKTKLSGRQVTVPVYGELEALLNFHREHPADTIWLFPEARVYHERCDGTLQKKFRDVAEEASLPKAITFHCFRHTRATRALNSDDPVSLIAAADLLGLSSLNTLRKYSHTTLAIKEKAMKS